MKTWIKKQKKVHDALLKQMGVKSWSELMTCSLLIHVSYGGEEDSGRSVLIKVERVLLQKAGIDFSFEHALIEVRLDPDPRIPMGGTLEACDCDEPIWIGGISFDKDGWAAFYCYENEWSQLDRSNIDVEIIKP